MFYHVCRLFSQPVVVVFLLESKEFIILKKTHGYLSHKEGMELYIFSNIYSCEL